ncbi:LysR family transcriptional regulator [Agaribacterium haliotis]|uniref:LysR family transcriptional regulator n=1 Tax=Agaribacterium haliotis TaxID=2013869 RepID=UPI000BB53838|nr:LysR family transcriptional regulator [Agaribacterium haliotis]
MDTEALKAFVSIAKSGSFSNAAQQLHLSQPAISKRIARLEEQLNHRLLDRLGRDLQLTEAGQLLLPRAEAILLELRETERRVRELSGEIIGNLSVATSHHVGLHHLPPILRAFASKHSHVNLQFEFLDSEQAHAKVLAGDCEFAIITLAPKIEAPLSCVELWQDPLEVVVSKQHQLAKKNKVELADLAKESAILPDLNTYTGRLIKDAFEQHQLSIKTNMATNYLETIKMMVSVGLGWSILPATMVDEQLTKLNIKELKISRTLGLIQHKKRSLSNAGRAFYDCVMRMR